MSAKPVFMNFEWVLPKNLARSSAPHYDEKVGDKSQNMDQAAIDALRKENIDSVISLNSIALPKSQLDLLANNKITFTHVPVEDFTAPTLAQLHTVWKTFKLGKIVLIYCGFGHGRTGTAISAIEIYRGAKLTRKDYDKNHVEKDSQRKVLDELQQAIAKDPNYPNH